MPGPFPPSTPRKILPAVLFGLALSLFLAPRGAAADIYRQVGQDGVESFTDAPVDDQIRLIIRESEEGRKERKKVSRALRSAPPSVSRDAGEWQERLPVSGAITSHVGLRNDPIDGLLRQHQGLDIAVPEGTQVHAVTSGRVVFSGTRNGYGNVVVVDHGEGVVSLYAHNAVNCVAAGEWIGRDAVLALSGSTGRSTGPHVHFELWKDSVNWTESYLRTGSLFGGSPAPYAHGDDEMIRRIVLADGSVLFTNLERAQP